MPNRVIKESIWDSPNLNKLSDLAERHFYRLLPLPDDFGCFRATTSVVKGRLYPTRTYITEQNILEWYAELEEHNLCKFWEEDGRLFGIFVNFDKHQRIRAMHQRKTPPPPENITQLNTTIKDILNLTTGDDRCRQVSSSDSGILYPNPSKEREKEVKEKEREKNSAPSAVFVDNLLISQETQNLEPGNSGTPKEKVEEFISGKTGFGSGGKRTDDEFREEVKKVCLVFIGRLKEWGDPVEDEREALNKIFPVMLSLICWGVAQKPKVKNLKGSYTPPEKAIKLIKRMSKPKNPVAELIDVFRKHPKYLP